MIYRLIAIVLVFALALAVALVMQRPFHANGNILKEREGFDVVPANSWINGPSTFEEGYASLVDGEDYRYSTMSSLLQRFDKRTQQEEDMTQMTWIPSSLNRIPEKDWDYVISQFMTNFSLSDDNYEIQFVYRTQAWEEKDGMTWKLRATLGLSQPAKIQGYVVDLVAILFKTGEVYFEQVFVVGSAFEDSMKQPSAYDQSSSGSMSSSTFASS